MNRPRVLVLDPAAESRELAQNALGRHCDLILQEHPLHLFEDLEIFGPDLVICELEMPVLDGFEVINLLQGEPGQQHLPLMIWSGHADVENQKLAYRMGASHFLAKPCRPSQLFKAAATFFRLAGGQLPERTHPMDEVERLLADRVEHHDLHPLLQGAVAAHERRHQIDFARFKRTMLAHVASRRG